MLRWPFKKKDAQKSDAASPDGDAPIGDEWAFLRSQPDHDADEMSSVRAVEELPSVRAAEERPSVRAAEERPSVRAADDLPPVRAAEEPPPVRIVPIAEDDLLLQAEALWSASTREEPADEPDAASAWKPGVAARRRERSAMEPEDPELVLALEVTVGGAAARFDLAGSALVGRRDAARGIEPEVDLTGDDGVSRRHAQITLADGCFTIRDLDSIGGTRLNGKWLSSDAETPLKPGDRLELGRGSLILVLHTGPPEAEMELTEEDLALKGMLRDALGTAPTEPPRQESSLAEALPEGNLSQRRKDAREMWIGVGDAGRRGGTH
jgi:hypothetical protein